MESCKVPFCDLVFLGITKSKSHSVDPVCWFLVCLRHWTHSHVFAFGCDGTLTRQSSPSGPQRKAKMRLAPSPDANVLLPKVNGRRCGFCIFVTAIFVFWCKLGRWGGYWLDLTENPSTPHGREDPKRSHALKQNWPSGCVEEDLKLVIGRHNN